MIENSSIYKVAIYMRLSKDDGSLKESESIINQRDFLMRFIKENNLELYDEYIDDGYSGTNFDRPNFKRMIDDIELKKINMIVTKDLSRLGRDYIIIGQYLEKYFPVHNVRYIAITDNIDTYVPQSNLDMAPFKAVFNDMYAKDISKKIITALRTKQKEGKWVGSCEPLGYMKDPNDKNHLIINENESWIVKKIFSLAEQGKGTYQIKNILEKENVPTYSILRNRKMNTYASKSIWSGKTIKGILTNELYTGDLVQNRRNKVNYKIKKIVDKERKDWIIIPNTHEAIIDKETFYLVNKKLNKNSVNSNKKDKRLLDGLLFCHECGRRLTIYKNKNKTYTVCNLYRNHSKLKLCTPHTNSYDDLEKSIINIIKENCFSKIDKEKLNQESKIFKKQNLINNNKSENYLKDKLKKLENNLDMAYIDKINERLSEDMFDRIRKKLFLEMDMIKQELTNNAKKEKNINIKENSNNVKNFINKEIYSKETFIRLIDRIEISENKQIDLFLNFKEI